MVLYNLYKPDISCIYWLYFHVVMCACTSDHEDKHHCQINDCQINQSCVETQEKGACQFPGLSVGRKKCSDGWTWEVSSGIWLDSWYPWQHTILVRQVRWFLWRIERIQTCKSRWLLWQISHRVSWVKLFFLLQVYIPYNLNNNIAETNHYLKSETFLRVGN